MKKALKDLNLPYSLLKVEAEKQEPKVLKKGADSIHAEWLIRIQYDRDKYRKVVLPKLKQVLGDIAIGKQIKDPLLHNVTVDYRSAFQKDWNKLGVYDYLFEKRRYIPPSFAGRLPRASRNRFGKPIQSNNKPVAGGVPVFLMEDWQPLTGQQTYRVYWVDSESAKVLVEYLMFV